MRTYSELIQLPTFEERFHYLKLGANVAESTFGFSRYLNQDFYRSKEWKRTRNEVIVRDNGCDLGIPDYPIGGRIYIHHIEPITPKDIIELTEYLLNPSNLICTSFETHNALHYGDDSLISNRIIIERTPNDTCPWR